MESRIKRRIAIGATGLVVLGGAGGTYAATQGGGDDERRAYLDNVAKRLEVSPEELTKALESAFSDRLDAAVAAGRLTREQADEMKQRAKERGGAPFLGAGRPGHGPHGGRHGGPLMGGIGEVAEYLGLSREKLHDELRSGKSLADVAKDRGKDVSGLKTTIERAVREKLDEAVKDRHLTKAQRDRMLDRLDGRIDSIVERSGGRPKLGGPPDWGGGRP